MEGSLYTEESRNLLEKDGINDTTRPPEDTEGRGWACSQRETLLYSRAEWWEHRWACNCSIKVKEFPFQLCFYFPRRHLDGAHTCSG